MACRFLKVDGHIVGIICGKKTTHKLKCYICGEPATVLCDAPVASNELGTCNRPLCTEHAHRIDKDTNVCPEHFNELNIKAAKKNRDRLERLGWKREDEEKWQSWRRKY